MTPSTSSDSRGVPRTVWVLGFVSLFMDLSSEMVHAFLPVFLVSTLGASTAVVGLIEGIAEGTASVAKFFSGALSDRLGTRKLLVGIGYALGAATKPFFALATAPFHVLTARFVDRVGKGIRGAPRDALVADVTPPDARGAAFGIRQGLDTAGAVAGPLLGILMLAAVGGDVRTVFALAAIPGFLAVALLVVGVEEPSRPERPLPPSSRFRSADLRSLPVAFWAVTAIGAVFTLARFSEAFLVLRASEAGLSLALVPVVMIAMNGVYSLVSAPAGRLSDRVDRRRLLAAGLAVLIAADLVLALVPTTAGALAGAALWGLHMGLSQGTLSAMVADTTPERSRGTAFGSFHLVSGVATLLASVLAGLLWQGLGPEATFAAGGAFATAALVGLLVLLGRDR